MYAIFNAKNKELEHDGDGLIVYYTDKAKIEKMVEDENKRDPIYFAFEAKELCEYALIDNLVLLSRRFTLDQSFKYALEESPERFQEIDILKEKILSMPIVKSPELPAIELAEAPKVTDYRVRLKDGDLWGNTEFRATGLFSDTIEMMRHVLDTYGNDISKRMEEDSSFDYVLDRFVVDLFDISENMVDSKPLSEFTREYRIATMKDNDQFLYMNRDKGIGADEYGVEAIETDSGKVENSGSVVVLCGPGGRTLGVHAGDFLEAQMTFKLKPEAARRFRP